MHDRLEALQVLKFDVSGIFPKRMDGGGRDGGKLASRVEACVDSSNLIPGRLKRWHKHSANVAIRTRNQNSQILTLLPGQPPLAAEQVQLSQLLRRIDGDPKSFVEVRH